MAYTTLSTYQTADLIGADALLLVIDRLGAQQRRLLPLLGPRASETARHQYLPYGSAFDNAGWGGGGSVAANAIGSPEGQLEADTWTVPAGGNATLARSAGALPRGTYTFSVYVKKGTLDLFEWGVLSDAFGWLGRYSYTFSTGVLANTAGTTAAASATLQTPASQGWIRLVMTVAATGPATLTPTVYGGPVGATTTGATMSLWAAQLEAGAAATPWIWSGSAAVTASVGAVALAGAMTATGLDPVPVQGIGDQPLSGTCMIGAERIRYRRILYAMLTPEERGADGTLPAAHSAGDAVAMPWALSTHNDRLVTGLVGDGGALMGLGALRYQAIGDLGDGWYGNRDTVQADAFLRGQSDAALQSLAAHIAKVGPDACASPAPSYAADGSPVATLYDYLRWLNDPVSGRPYSALAGPEASHLTWLYSGSPLHPKTVYPERTEFWRGTVSAGPVLAAIAPTAAINRYPDTSDPLVFVPGYCAQRLQARVTAPGCGALVLTAICEGMDAAGAYFGRAAGGGEDGASADASPTPRSFTHTTDLDMSQIGASVELLFSGTAGVRVTRVLSVAAAGPALSGELCIESIPDRVIT